MNNVKIKKTILFEIVSRRIKCSEINLTKVQKLYSENYKNDERN